jgi:hypothetical protein
LSLSRLRARRRDRRRRDVLRQEVHDLMRGAPPTVELLRPVGPDIPSDARVQQVLDLCIGFGEVLLSSREGAEETSATMIRVAAACGLRTVDVDVTFTSITMCCHRGKDVVPLMTMRLVRHRTIDLTRLAETRRIVARVERGRMGVSAASAALAEVVHARPPTRGGSQPPDGPGWPRRPWCCSAAARSSRCGRSWSPR